MIPTVVVIPSRYDPRRLRRLVRPLVKEAEVLVLDNGHEPVLALHGSRITVVNSRGDGIYRQWNRGWQLALERHNPVNVAILNDDIEIGPGTLTMLAKALRADDRIGCVYPDPSVRTGPLPDEISYTTEWDPAGGRSLSGFCFMFKGELPLPPFDEGMEWWYGDSEFDESVKLAGYGVARIDKLPITHISDAELNDWARRPELKEATERDGIRWAERHDHIVDGRWVPKGEPMTVILVPRRDDNGPRDVLWAWCKARWQRIAPDIPIYEGHHNDGPFNRSMAINRAADLADAGGHWTTAVVIDADIFIRESQVRAAIGRAEETGRVTWAHRRWRGLAEDHTTRLLDPKRPHDFGPEVDRDDMDIWVERTNPLSWSCCIVIPRAVWDDLGGFDERFIGWGFEDMAFQSTVCGLYGHERIDGDVYHLWHPRVFGSGRAGKEDGEYSRDAVTNARLGRRYMVALRRDHGLHDRDDMPATDEERERDVANLKRDDLGLARSAKRLGLPDWSDWWPTLEELRAGAKAARFGGSPNLPTVTVIVHTDGRREYIAKAIPSLLERVTGPIVKRVIYDDSGDPEYKAWLVAEFGREARGETGFHVVGPATRLGYTGSMAAMWRYLSERCASEFVFAVEDDFVYDADVDLAELATVLKARPYLTQMALLRSPAYQSEIDKGGVLGWPQESFEPVRLNGYGWMEHQNFWTMNPSLFRRSLTGHPWPMKASSERVFGDLLLKDEQARFAFWGSGEPMIEHIGAVRVGHGY